MRQNDLQNALAYECDVDSSCSDGDTQSRSTKHAPDPSLSVCFDKH